MSTSKANVMSLQQFCRAHGGKKGKMINLGQMEDFVSLQTVDGCCFLSFAKTQFPSLMTLSDVQKALKTEDLDVIEGTTRDSNKQCFTIVRHLENIYEAFDF